MRKRSGKPARRIVTGEDVQALPEGSVLPVVPGTIFTDVAREWIDKRRIRVVDSQAGAKRVEPVTVALGADHAGLELKESLKAYLEQVGATFLDCGAHSPAPVDYPDFAEAVAMAVAFGHARRGIVVDGAGIGSAIAANKVPGIRAAACHDEATARNAREHNDVNVLTLGSRLTPLESVRKIVSVFLSAQHTEPRHKARVAKIEAIETKHYRPLT